MHTTYNKHKDSFENNILYKNTSAKIEKQSMVLTFKIVCVRSPNCGLTMVSLSINSRMRRVISTPASLYQWEEEGRVFKSIILVCKSSFTEYLQVVALADHSKICTRLVLATICIFDRKHSRTKQTETSAWRCYAFFSNFAHAGACLLSHQWYKTFKNSLTYVKYISSKL